MALKVKIGPVGILGMLKFKNMRNDREKMISKAPAKEINPEFTINNLAKKLHPKNQLFKVSQVIDHPRANAKSYILKRLDESSAALFRAGQYVSVQLKIGESKVSRPYSIASSPALAEKGEIMLTVKRVPDGFVSNWILDNWEAGSEVTLSGPEGQFYYEELRDGKNVLALAGGSGITPFLSMAYAIRDGAEDFNLTILYGSRSKEAVLFEDELFEIASRTPKVKIVHVLSEGDLPKEKGYEKGFLSQDLIKKYIQKDSAVFVCGPEAMYSFVKKELDSLDIPRRKIRFEVQAVPKTDAEEKTYTLKVTAGFEQKEISMLSTETVLVALERAGIKAPSGCRAGECGWCRAKLLSGTFFTPPQTDHRRYADKENGFIHPCCTYPTSDMEIEVSVS